MKLEQSFEVAAPAERVWEALIDVERVAPCLPGASVIARNEDGSYTGEFKVKIGPTSAAYSGRLHLEDVDAGARTSTMQAAGTDKRGQGGAKATIVSTVATAGDDATKVDISTDYQITGRLARFGRGGMIEEISERLLGEFAVNLQELLAEPAPVAAADPDAVIEGAMPVAGALVDEPASPDPDPDPASSTPDPEPAPSTPQPTPARAIPATPPPYTPPAEPAPGGSALLTRARENPAPLVALVFGFLLALRVLRRRS